MVERTTFTIIAHRGASSLAPENTIAAFDKALELGFRHMELDAQLSADGVAVVFHDFNLDRTTNGRGPLAARTFDDLRGLDAGSWFSPQFAGERIPSLDEVLARYRGRAHLHVELKAVHSDLPRAVATLLQKHGWASPEHSRGVTVSSFRLEMLRQMRTMLPATPLAWLVGELSEDVVRQASAAGLRGVCPRASLATREAVAAARARGLRVRAWGVSSTADLKHLVECGVEGATVDWPHKAREFLASLGVETDGLE